MSPRSPRNASASSYYSPPHCYPCRPGPSTPWPTPGPYDPDVPTPESVLGYEVGERFTPHHMLLRYFERVAEASDRVSLAPAGIAPKEVTDVPVTDALLGLVRSGAAVSAMASWVAAPDLAGGRLRALRIGRRGLHRTWWAVLSERHPPPPAVSRFVEILRRTCRNVPGADRAEA